PDQETRLGRVAKHAQQVGGSLHRFWHPLPDRREGEEIEVLARFQGGELLLNKVLDKGGLMVEVATRRISEQREWGRTEVGEKGGGRRATGWFERWSELAHELTAL